MRSLSIIFALLLLLAVPGVACADSDNSVIYAVSGNTFSVYDPNAGTLNTYSKPYQIDNLATTPGILYMTYRNTTGYVFLEVISTENYQTFKTIPVYYGTKDSIAVSGTNVYMLADSGVKKIDWIQDVITTTGLTGTFYSITVTTDNSDIVVGGAQNITVLDPVSMSITYTTTDDRHFNKIIGVGGNDIYYIDYTSTPSYRGSAQWGGAWTIASLEETGSKVLKNFDTIPSMPVYAVYSNSPIIAVNNNFDHVEFNSNSSSNTAIVTSNDGSRLYVASSNANILQVYSTNSTYTHLGNITMPGKVTAMYKGYSAGYTHLVRFKLQTLFGVVSLGGIDCAIYGDTPYTTFTDDSGSIAVPLSPDRPIELRLSTPAGSTHNPDYELASTVTYTIIPSDSYYEINIPITNLRMFDDWTTSIIGEQNNILVKHNADMDVDHNIGKLNISVLVDTAAADVTTVNSVTVTLYKNNSTVGGTPGYVNTIADDIPVTIADKSFASGSAQYYNVNLTIPNAAGNSYYADIMVAGTFTTGEETTTASRHYFVKYQYPGPTVAIPGIPLEWYWWLAAVPTFFILCAGTVTRKGYLGVFAMVAASIFNIWGWFSLYTPQLIMWAPIALGFLLSIAMILVEAERYK